MDEWFHYNHILREKRLAYAISQLVGDARQWWLQEVDYRWYYKEPSITSWRDLKKLLMNKYAPQANAKKPALFQDQKKFPAPVEAKTQPALVEKLIKHYKNKKMEDTPTSQPKKVTKQVAIHKQSLKPSFESCDEAKQCHSTKHENEKTKEALKEKPMMLQEDTKNNNKENEEIQPLVAVQNQQSSSNKEEQSENKTLEYIASLQAKCTNFSFQYEFVLDKLTNITRPSENVALMRAT
ncbi:uncharacterized protein LOC111831854 [Capsella rubella]|uniref:uncharacterized protein LOC111831854 n=1 Tax=Capsella rubella TaxID=81985 RepID=UPI000CD5125A|nr:uncharacterized protein LOC111831854 [Capsella rubella]